MDDFAAMEAMFNSALGNTNVFISLEDSSMFVVLFLFGFVVVLYVAVRLLHLNVPSQPPLLFYKDNNFNRTILSTCNLLTQVYVPTLIWGKSGHLQTIIYGKLGRVNSPFPSGQRISKMMRDGATMTFDIFEPQIQHPSGGDYTLVICPGIANSSESLYICTCVHYAQNQGYRVAVLNHLGALKSQKLTAPRIFTYGGIDEYGGMVSELKKRYPLSKLIAVGFSMGANIVLKYLGIKKQHQQDFIAAMSCCQGYDAEAAMPHMLSWEHMRRVYHYAMTQHQKSILKRNYDVLFGPESWEKYGKFDVDRIFKETSLIGIDEHYTRRREGFDSVIEYYKWTSCKYYMNNIQLPCFILNALDDPIVPEQLLNPAKEMALSHNNVIHCQTYHGGHLGFFEGGMLYPDTITWLDKIVVQYADAIVIATQHGVQ